MTDPICPQAYDKKRREAYVKTISERIKKEDKAKKERKDYYTEQKRMSVSVSSSLKWRDRHHQTFIRLEHRIWHVKVLSSIAVLAFGESRFLTTGAKYLTSANRLQPANV